MEVARRRTMTDRMIGAAMLDSEAYEDVEADTAATSQAALVVGLVALAAAAGGVRDGGPAVLVIIVAAYLSWLLWSGVTFVIGEKLLGGTATWGELLRTIAFAQSPGILYTAGAIPVFGHLITTFVAFWILLGVIVAIRQALDFGTGRAILTALLGFIPYLILSGLVRGLVGIDPGPG